MLTEEAWIAGLGHRLGAGSRDAAPIAEEGPAPRFTYIRDPDAIYRESFRA